MLKDNWTIVYRDKTDIAPLAFHCEAENEEEARDIWANECPGEEIISCDPLGVCSDTYGEDK
jgi:hypothetical protein